MRNKANNTESIYQILFFIVFFLGVSQSMFSQKQTKEKQVKIVTDSIVPSADISIQVAEDRAKAIHILNTSITDKGIAEISLHNDSLLKEFKIETVNVDSLVARAQGLRELKNKREDISRCRETAKDNRDELKSKIQLMDAQLQYLSTRHELWEKTKKYSKSKIPILNKRMIEIINLLDSTNIVLSDKSNKLLVQMDKSTEMTILLDNKVAEIDTTLHYVETVMLGQRKSSMLGIDYGSITNWNLVSNFKSFTQDSIDSIKSYFQNRVMSLIILCIIFILLVFFFAKSRKHLGSDLTGFGEWYKKHLYNIIVHYWSSATVITIFICIFVFTDRPFILRDIIGYLLIMPLVFILRTLLNKRFHVLINALPFLMIPYAFFIVFPINNAICRIALFLMTGFQIGLVWKFLRIFKTIKLKNEGIRIYILLFAYAQASIAGVGFIASFLGYTTLAENFMFAIYTNIIFGSAIFILGVLVNGLFLIAIDSSNLHQKLRFVELFGELLKRRIVTVVNILLILSWTYLFLVSLGIEYIVGKTILDFFSHQYKIGKLDFSFGSFAIFFLVIYISTVLANMIRALLEEDILNKMKLSKGLPHTIAIMTRYTIITFGICIAFAAAGVHFGSMAVIISAFGVGIGFGLQNIFNNLVSGFILLFERPIQLGDMIEVGTLLGRVKSIGIRSSNVETVDGAEVIVPNGQLVSAEVVNWTLSDQKRRVEILVGVSYNCDPHLVKKLLDEILAQRKDILQDPAPIVFFKEFGDSSLDFRILFWTPEFGESVRIRSEVIFSIFDVFKEHNIEIPFPQRDLHLRSVDPEIKINK